MSAVQITIPSEFLIEVETAETLKEAAEKLFKANGHEPQKGETVVVSTVETPQNFEQDTVTIEFRVVNSAEYHFQRAAGFIAELEDM